MAQFCSARLSSLAPRAASHVDCTCSTV